MLARRLVQEAQSLVNRAATALSTGNCEEAVALSRQAQQLLTTILRLPSLDPLQKPFIESLLARAESIVAECSAAPAAAEKSAEIPKALQPEVKESRAARPPSPSAAAGETGEATVEEEFLEKAKTFITKAEVTWDDIAGLDEAKNLIIEALYYSIARPEKPVDVEVPRRFLLYGPPGTGKTMLAAAASKMLGATFFNVPISGILSKYVGDSPKMVSAVFTLARRMAPSVVFFDEIDAIAVSRELSQNQVTGLLQTLLQELDGVASKGRKEVVIVMAATNKPWMLDEAVLRRFDLYIYVPLPDEKARRRLFEIHLLKKGYTIEPGLIDWLVEKTKGYSGADIARLCRRAVTYMLRRMNPPDRVRSLVSGGESIDKLRSMVFKVDVIRREDFEKALMDVKPTVDPSMLARYEEWKKRMGG